MLYEVITIIGSYTLNTKWAVGWSWKYYTGQAITLPEQTYVLYLPSQINGQIPEMPEDVITSYSIHYTKLYDSTSA